MEKILVTTDKSANSKAAIRFAIKLASQRKAELIILHVYHLLKPFKWTEHAFAAYTDQFRKKTAEELSSFIAKIYHDIDERVINYELVLVSNIDAVDGITDYASRNNCSYICVSTHGASTITKLFGTNTAKLISCSAVPVICIPSRYHLKELKHIVYASDMTDYENELKKVVDFARPLGASVEMVHISYLNEFTLEKELAEAGLQKKAGYKISLLNLQRDVNNNLLEDIDRAVKIRKASLLVLFTHQSRSMMERLFFPSNAKEYSFSGKVPLLTFKKREGK